MKVYEYIEKFQVKYCDVDFKDELKPSVALALMEEVASNSAEELGFGYSFVKPRGYAFMVTNVCVDFLRPIGIGDVLKVKTWPLPPSYVIFGREYRFCDEENQPLLNASSRWCLVDMATGKLLQSKVIENQDYSTYNTARAVEDVKWKLPSFKQEEGELRFTIRIANSEYDHNMHVNNTRYADYCFNCFTVAELKGKELKRFALSYIRQCHEGDVLRFYRKPCESGGFLVHGFNEAGDIVVQSHIVFAD